MGHVNKVYVLESCTPTGSGRWVLVGIFQSESRAVKVKEDGERYIAATKWQIKYRVRDAYVVQDI